MELNLTIPHLFGFISVVWMVSFFITGSRLWRVIGWVGLWQLLTPLRPIWLDIPMMVASFVVVEWAYFMVLKIAGNRSA